MAQARLSVRKIRDVLRLKNEAHLSDRQIAAVLGSTRSTVQKCLKRARLAGLSWPLPAELDDEELSAGLCATISDAGFWEMVHKGLGEMQNLATGVGDLKRIFSNVKVRGTWAEVQVAGILEQMLTPEQWSMNVNVKDGSLERVEYAIRLPGAKDEPNGCVWIPIDSKFPTEDYARLQSAAEAGDPVAVLSATEALLRAMRAAAKDIHEKYVNPPTTTDYAIMFLATESLYAEALREPPIRRGDSAEVSGGDCWSDNAVRDCEQFEAGVSVIGG